MFLEKNKIIGCRLFITTLQPLEFTFFNSITKFLTILYFEPFSIFFYLLFFSCMLYNSKWPKKFQAYNQLNLKNESKKAPPFQTFFPYENELLKYNCLFFRKSPKRFLSIQTLISCNLHGGNFYFLFTSSWTSILQDHTVSCVQKCNLKNKLILVLKIVVWEHFWWKHS